MEFTFKGPLERVGGALLGAGALCADPAALILIICPVFQRRRTATGHQGIVIGRHTVEQALPLYEDLVRRYPGTAAADRRTKEADTRTSRNPY
jgi:hypothetical protein